MQFRKSPLPFSVQRSARRAVWVLAGLVCAFSALATLSVVSASRFDTLSVRQPSRFGQFLDRLTNGTNGNQVGVSVANAWLGALANYGGSTATIPLLSGSPAINAGTSAGAPSTDQRGIARPPQTTKASVSTTEFVNFTWSNASLLIPTLGNYSATAVNLAQQATATPSAAPTNATSIVATASSGFNGTLRANPTTGVVSIVNAAPAGTYTITVNAFGNSGMTTASFQLTVQTGTACGTSPLFTSAADVTGVSSPLGTAVGDFNNDGKQDLVTANGSNATASIRLGDGAGGFTGTTTVTTPSNPNAVAVGDFNGDGNQDIAVSSSNNAVAIRLGNGAGGFTGTTDITTGQTTKSIALGDFNNDGKLDFVTADIGGDTATVALGNGAGGFPTVSTVSVGDGPGQVVVADFNSDGKLDFATSNQLFNPPGGFGSPGTVTVRIGNGDGTFTNGPSYDVGTNPEYLAVGDFNEDGKPDLITSNQNSASLSLILGDVSNTVTPPTPTTIATSLGPGEIRVADINRDGHQDVAFKRSGLENFAYLLGTGTGSFGTTVTVPVTGAAGTKLAVGDFNADGYQDFVTANFSANALFVQLGGCNVAPTITAGGPLTRQQGSTGSVDTIATVNDTETLKQNLTVAVVSPLPTGISVTSISAPNATTGAVTATIRADCNATTGNNIVALRVTDGNGATATTNLTVTVNAATAPTPANAGADQAFCNITTVTLAANTPSVGTGAWSVVSGPSTSTAQFNSLSNPTANFTPTGGLGSYTLRWTITGACATSTDNVVLTFNAPPTTANAGPDQTLCNVTSVTMAGNAASIGTGTWTQVNGPNTAAITTPNSPTTTMTGLVAGVYTFQWTIANTPACTASSDQVTITINAAPVMTTQPTNQLVALNGTATFTAAASGTPTPTVKWQVSTNGGTNYTDLPGQNSTTLTLNNVTSGMNGNLYRAVFTNSCTTINSNAATLTTACVTSLTVNNTGDGADATPGNGVCETAAGNGICTLRAALQEAHAQLACAPFTINFAVTGTINLTSALPLIFHPDLTLNGPGAQQLAVRYNTSINNPIFEVKDNNASAKKLTVSGLTIRDGVQGISAYEGSQVVVNDCVVTNLQLGLGLATGASMTVNNSLITSNVITNTFAAPVTNLGGTLTMTNSTIINNVNMSSINTRPSALLLGGGTSTLTNCTISGNTGEQTMLQGILGSLPESSLAVTLTNCTVAGNTLSSATTAYGVLETVGDAVRPVSVQLKNTLVAGNTVGLGANFRTTAGGTVTSLGNNLDSDGSSGFTNGVNGNVVGTVANPLNALLAALGNYGGATPTIALLPGSPAINAGTSSGAPTNDQRGIARVGNVDIGAFESRGFTQTLASGNNQSAPVNSAFANPLTVTLSSAFNEPVNGGRVSFTAPASGASAALVGDPATIANGQAAVTATANANTGTYQVTATANGGASSTSFTLTNICQSITVTAPATNTGTVGMPFSQTFTQAGGIGATTFSVASGTLPSGLTLAANGTLSGTPTQTGTFNLTVSATDSNGCQGTSTTYTLTNICQSITVTAPATNTGTVGTPFSQTFTQAGGVGTTTFSVASGTLPSGLTLAANGNLSGTPTQAGSFPVTVRATDANGCQGISTTYTLTINCQALTVNPANATLPGGRAGTPYSQSFTAAGNLSAVSFTVSAGSLPTGLTLSGGGALTGTPSVFGSFSFTVRATEANGCFGERAYSLTLLPPCGTLTLNPASLANGFQTRAYNQTLTATGGTAPYTFAVTSGSLPGGLSLASGGALTGTPTASGTFNFTVTTTDDTGCTGTRSYTVIVSGDGLQFFPLAAPVRLLDTRTGATACTQPNAPVAGQTSLTQAGRNFCGIPANAVALTGNVSTINSGGGFLTLYPSDAAQPTVANSTYGVNEVITNVFTVGLGAGDGAFKIFAFNTTDVAVDVTGYYAPPAPNGLYFHPLPTPVRLLDTRAGATGCVTPGAPLPGNTDTPQQAITTCSGIPAAARALVGNATTVSPQGFGYLTLFPGDANRPLVASSTYSPGQTVNGPFTVGLAPNGEFKVFTFAATDLAIDVVGYYSTEVSDVNGAGLLFAPLPQPVRLLETRNLPVGCFKPNAPLTGQQEYTQTVRGTCDGVTIPSTALAAVGNATAVTPQGFGFLTLWPSGAARPLVATATYSPSEVTNRHFIVGLGASDGAFKMYTFATSHLVIDLSGYFAP